MRTAISSGAPTEGSDGPTRYRRVLATGILLFRWVWLGWMIALATSGDFRLPGLAWASIGAAGGWTVWLTATRHHWSRAALWFDLAICAWLIVASGVVVHEGDVISGRPFFATGYPLSAALFWGASRGPAGGLVAAGILGTLHAFSRPINGVSFDDLTYAQIQNVAGAFLNYVVAGVAIGVVARVLIRSTRAVEEAQERLIEERERAARLAEREQLARRIHDSVLQALTLVNKQGRELSRKAEIPAEEVARLADIAGKQERELRALITRAPEDELSGRASLRHALEEASRQVTDLEVNVSSVGPVWLERRVVDELAAAVGQALQNVARHAHATHATVFADEEDEQVVISVKDDGVGFDYDEVELARSGKAGILKSMKGRAEDLGGSMSVTTSPGTGTEVEFRVPADPGADTEDRRWR